MKIKKLLFLIFLFLNVILCHSQNIEGKITFLASAKKVLNYIQKEDGKENKKRERKHVNELYKNAKDINVILRFNNSMSEYYTTNKMNVSNNENINLTRLMAGGGKTYYVQNSKMSYNCNTLDCSLLGECFLIETIAPKWELKQDTKIIQGFLCYKAILRNKKTKKITVEAWYAPKIPYQYGVMNYYDLPGVILEINKNTFTITAIKIEINPIEKISIEIPKKVKKVTEKEFKSLTRKAMPGFYKRN